MTGRRRRLWGACALLLVAGVALGLRFRLRSDDGGREAAPKPFAGQVVELTDSLLLHGGSDTLRLGRLGAGETARQLFALRNTTAHPVVVVRVNTSCGCSQLTYDRAPILPGAEARATLSFDTRGLKGWQFKRLELCFAEGESLWLYVEAEVE